ncbi:hypothetical protein BKA65DRAFT_502232 [Rhexocercosporidium sp. MPI-PUGE-AT-0058]|nr:hypothetical protein BKA65DRAFT_502232 [Rhexocercosporidium sp. MPI-PUGE-AT-0058]
MRIEVKLALVYWLVRHPCSAEYPHNQYKGRSPRLLLLLCFFAPVVSSLLSGMDSMAPPETPFKCTYQECPSLKDSGFLTQEGFIDHLNIHEKYLPLLESCHGTSATS